MRLHPPLGLPYAPWLLSHLRCPPKYRSIRRMALSSLPGPLRGATGIWHRGMESKIWLVHWEPTIDAGKMIRSNPNYVKMAEEYEKSTISTSDTRNEAIDKKIGQLGTERIGGSQQAYSPMEIYARQTYQGQSSF